MAVRRLQLVRTRAGRKPQNVDLNTVKEMTDIWAGSEDVITEAFGEWDAEEDYSQEGLTDGVIYTDRQSAQKVAQAYKGYLEKHYPNLFEKRMVTEENEEGEEVSIPAPLKVAAVTGKNPEGEGFVFSLNPEKDDSTTGVNTVPVTADSEESEEEPEEEEELETEE